jgi:hypothetical protein
MGEMRITSNILVGKPKGKSSLGRPRRKLGDNIRMELREIGWEIVDWIHRAWDRDRCLDLVNTAMNLRVSYKVGNFLTSSVNY